MIYYKIDILEKRLEELQEEELEDDIIQPENNKSIRLFEESKHARSAIDMFRNKRDVTPTDFLSNNDEYGRLKESNESIFSFGTSRRKF